MKLAKGIKMMQFRLNLRKTLQQESYDLLVITNEELKREFNRRNKQNGIKQQPNKHTN